MACARVLTVGDTGAFTDRDSIDAVGGKRSRCQSKSLNQPKQKSWPGAKVQDNLEKAHQADKTPAVQLKLADGIVEGEVIGLNNENNTAVEGMKKVSGVALLTGAIGLAPAAASLGVNVVHKSLPVIGGLGGAVLGATTVSLKVPDIRAIVAAPVVGGLLGRTLGKTVANLFLDVSGLKQMRKFNLIAGVAGVATAGLQHLA